MKSNGVSAFIENWSAWSPGRESKEDWVRWARGDSDSLTDSSDAPALKFLPPMFRRRMSQLCKASLHVAFDCLDGTTGVPSVFASRHGEMHRLVSLLKSILLDDDVSPAAFSSSVHNTASGLFSIADKNMQPSTALAGGAYTLPHAFLDAVTIMHTGGHERVLLVVADESVHETYRPIMDVVSEPLAMAFLLARSGDVSLSLCRDASGSSECAPGECKVASFLKWFVAGGKQDMIQRGRLFDTVWSLDDTRDQVPA